MNDSCLLVLTGAYFSSGGISAVNRLVIQSLKDKFSLTILTLNENKTDIEIGTSSFSTKHIYKGFSGSKLSFVLNLWSYILRNKYSIIMCDHVNIAFGLAPFAWMRLVNYKVWLYGIEVFEPNPSIEGKIGMSLASDCLAISQFTAQNVAKRYPRLKIQVCELSIESREKAGFDLTLLNNNINDRKMISITNKPQRISGRLILHVGRMEATNRTKNQDILIKAFPKVQNIYPDAQLALLGDGENLEQIKLLANNLPGFLKSNIFIPGFVNDELLQEFYQSCYLFAMPGIGEGFGLVFIEAMSYGKPCIGANSDAVPYLIKNGENGMLVDDPDSPDELAEKIIWLFDHPEEAKRMGERGRELVLSKYLFHHFKERFWKAIDI